MSANELLFFMVLLSAVILLSVSLRQFARSTRGWALVAVSVIGIIATLRSLAPEVSGFVALVLWAVLVVTPLGLARIAGAAVMREQYPRAVAVLRVARWFHPVDGWWDQHQLIRGLQLGHEGRVDEAAELLARYSKGDSALSRFAVIHGHRLLQRWRELAAWLMDAVGRGELERHASLRAPYLRALGESGALRALLDEYRALDKPVPAAAALHIAYCRLFLLAFGGRVAAVERLLGERLSQLPEGVRDYWIGTALLAAGELDEARELLQALAEAGPSNHGRAASWRLANPPALASEVVEDADRALLDAVEREIEVEERYTPTPTASFKRSYLTHGILAVNLVVFALEVALGGSEDWPTLLRLGAIFTAPPYDAQWWRLFSATVLHAGWIHLTFNMAALVLFAPYLELRLGRPRLLGIYLLAGLGGMGSAVLWARFEGEIIALVGASAGIMGLIGATAAVMLRGWREEGARPAQRRLVLLASIVLLQAVVDIYIPEISFLAHFGGAVTGFAVTAVLLAGSRTMSGARAVVRAGEQVRR
jgi:rhomboid protease GluP